MRILIILWVFPLYLCSQIIDFELQKSWSITDVQDVYTFNALPDYIGEINYEVDGYKISYMAPNEEGDLVINSGAIFLPVNALCSSPMLSWQHGTIVSDLAAPSENIDESIIGVVSASHGYVVVMSDYLGLGSGEGFHNYCHATTEASSVINLIVEGLVFAESQGVNTNSKIFLMGYSQGGHSTMASVRDIEQNWSDVLNITASAPMAGPYSMSEAQTEMLNVVYPNPGYFPYVIFAYQNVYNNIYEEVSDIFRPGFDNLLEMYDGTYSMNAINEEIWSIANEIYGISQLEFTPLDMIKNDYYENFINNLNHPFRLALEDNDLINFTPQSPMRLIHCSGDDNVPFENATMAFNNFSPLVSEDLVLLDGGDFDHSECALLSIISAKIYFDTLADFCSEVSLENFYNVKNKVATFDLLGRDVTSLKSKGIVLHIFDDGSIKKFYSID